MRKIIHVDMDAFYASIEQRDDPDLKGKPIVVGGSRERGVVAAASYEARKYDIRSAMSSRIAFKNCPQLIFVKPRFKHYKEISQHIMSIFKRYTDLVEPLSLDEAYLDVTENKAGLTLATEIASEIRMAILEETELTASAGISMNKFLAKVASDVNKPNGQKLIHPKKAEAFVENLPIEKFFGIGKVTASKMKSRGIFTGADLKQYGLEELVKWYGKSGNYYYNIARAIDYREVQPSRERKSLGVETTFEKDLSNQEELQKILHKLSETLLKRLENSGTKGRTLTLKIKYYDFTVQTRSKTFKDVIMGFDFIFNQSVELLFGHQQAVKKPIRLLGITVGSLNKKESEEKVIYQLTLDF